MIAANGQDDVQTNGRQSEEGATELYSLVEVLPVRSWHAAQTYVAKQSATFLVSPTQRK